jgi:phosphoribosylanthranilate isomerase
MKIKVCGLELNKENQELNTIDGIDYLGFIFYSKSKRFVEKTFETTKKKVGVFVNETQENIEKRIRTENLYAVQLHGNESPKLCLSLTEKALVIKAFNVETTEDFSQTRAYENKVDFFLFDSKSKEKGGSGKQFNWELIHEYRGNTPFFLSGGIGPADVERIKQLKHPHLYGIDLNSCFEIEPKRKNSKQIKKFITELQ